MMFEDALSSYDQKIIPERIAEGYKQSMATMRLWKLSAFIWHPKSFVKESGSVQTEYGDNETMKTKCVHLATKSFVKE